MSGAKKDLDASCKAKAQPSPALPSPKMSEDREHQESATAGDSLLKPDESKESVMEEAKSDTETLASPGTKPEVKYVSADSQNGDAKIDIESVRAVFVGMGKEELMRFANDPFWVRTRWVLFAFFWFLWLAMLVGAIVIIVVAPRCSATKKAQWWERSPLYEVNVRSFKDGSRMADGVGDIEGMRSKLDYIKDLGVSGVILSSIFPTGSDSSPESVTDFKAIHPDLGNMEDFKELLTDLKARDLRLVLDMVPNHSGKEHKWFQESVKKTGPYKDFYVWSPGKVSDQKNQPPNNWKSVNGGSAWEWNEERNEFYLHQFGTSQPDLNFHNPLVREEFSSILKFWLDLGVNGFQLRRTPFLAEDKNLQDEQPGRTNPGATLESYDFYDHKRTSYLTDSLRVLGHWHSVVSNSSAENMLLIRDEFPLTSLTQNGEAGNDTVAVDELLQTPNFWSRLPQNLDVTVLSKSIRDAIDRIPSKKPVLALEDGEGQRLASKFAPGVASALQMVTLLLPGTPLMYYGDEIGLKDAPQSSGNQFLAPMQWNSSTNAGFTSESIKPWISINNPATTNVAAQLEASESQLKTFRELVATRKTMLTVMLGKTNITVLNATRSDGTILRNSVLAFTRIKSGNPGVLVAVNPSKEELTVNFSAVAGVAEELTVHVKTVDFSSKDLQVKGKTQSDAVKLPPESGVTFTFVYKGEEE